MVKLKHYGRMTNVKVNELASVTRYRIAFAKQGGRDVYVLHNRAFHTWAEVGHYLMKDINANLLPSGNIDLRRLLDHRDNLNRPCFYLEED